VGSKLNEKIQSGSLLLITYLLAKKIFLIRPNVIFQISQKIAKKNIDFFIQIFFIFL
jgi:hypothetical protein